MRKFLVALVLLPLLALPGACSPSGIKAAVTIAQLNVTNPISLQQVFDLRAAYVAGFLVPANVYVNEVRRCKAGETTLKNVCSEPRIVRAIQIVVRAAGPAIQRAEDFIVANPTLNAGAVFDAAKKAVAEAERIRALWK